jgi:putative oxidoreductase
VTNRHDLYSEDHDCSGPVQQRQSLVRRSSVKAAATRLVALVLAPTPSRLAWPATAARIGSGAIFIGFGLSKFTQHAQETRAFDRYGLPDPDVLAYATGTLEVVLGAMLVLGLLTRLAALGMAGNMVGAIATGGRVDGGFVNLVLAPILLVTMLFLLRAGAGRWSLDNRLPRLVPSPLRARTVLQRRASTVRNER